MWNSFSDRVRDLKPSAIRKYFAIPADAISLGIGEPDFTTPKAALNEAIRSLVAGETHYTANSGIVELREAISEYIDKLYGVKYDPDNEIIVTVGASEALFLAISTVLNPGDEMIVVTPCFVSYQAGIQLVGGKPVEVSCKLEDNFDLNVADVKAAITDKTRGILIGFPSNPTGAVASRESLQKLCDLAVKHDLAVISDEIYGRLIYDTNHVCFATLKGALDRCMIVNGFSKSHAMTGFRVGYLCGPEHIMKQCYKIHQYLIMSAPTTAQRAGVVALRDCEADVENMRKEYNSRRRLLVETLNSFGLTTFEPKGAFYVFPQITSTGLTSEQFADRLLAEEKVALVPGSGFGKGGEGFVRISYATAYEKIEKALERIEKFVNKVR
jgi:aminotransferase